MPRITQPFDSSVGPLLRVTISDPASYRPSDASPQAAAAMMLLDTGASDSWIRGDIADRLGLPIAGLDSIAGFSGLSTAYQYVADAELWLDTPYLLDEFQLFRFDPGSDRIDGILGRDVLALGQFILDDPAGTFSLRI